ncbi:MAG TPA: glutamate mutase L [Candidatus Rifleibacterium sp.]|nr:glutamate mutase L [Candidatus Rifleibacterium sp.]HPT47091.1 glutamate mutase L [Candidatus Rifleibacterium sp.]
MTSDRAICVDIGSTWTKAAVFRLADDRFVAENRAAVATSVDYLPDAFFNAVQQVCPGADWRSLTAATAPCPVYFSSSAKGGLKVAVVGLVPEMSLQIARLAAFSAGARICASYPYRLTRASIAAIESAQPDILLLCGGTDGGNERYVTENAQALAGSDFRGTVIFAGNNAAADRVSDLLAARDLVITANLMPDFGRLNIEPVREAIRSIFLDKIVAGKGLDRLVTAFATQPVPTPLAVLNLVRAIGDHADGWQNFALIDMGGATTDFYSHSDSWYPESGTVMKGIVEPRLKRTVEGDLGMRVSAESTFETGEAYLAAVSDFSTEQLAALSRYTSNLTTNTSHLPANAIERHYDSLLAGACIYHSLMRHAGSIEEVFTTRGPVWAQTGKDLRRINRLVGTGGYLAAMGRNGDPVAIPDRPVQPAEKVALLPQNFVYYADFDYILPLLGNLAEKFPRACALTAVSALRQTQHYEVKEPCQREFNKA